MQRREGPLVGGVDASVVLDQQGGDVHVLVGAAGGGMKEKECEELVSQQQGGRERERV